MPSFTSPAHPLTPTPVTLGSSLFLLTQDLLIPQDLLHQLSYLARVLSPPFPHFLEVSAPNFPMSFMWPTCLILQLSMSPSLYPLSLLAPPSCISSTKAGMSVTSVCWYNPRSKTKASYMKQYNFAPRIPRPCLILTHSCLMSIYDSYRHFSGLS